MPTTDEATGRVLRASGILIGEEAHIRSSKPGGPRHEQECPDFDSYGNLILLCPTHHSLVDKDGGAEWSTERLEAMKASHEEWVRARLSRDELAAMKLEVLVAAEVQRLEELLLERWAGIYWQMSQAIPGLAKHHFDALTEAGVLLLAKDWPPSFPQLAAAGERLRILLAILSELLYEAFRLDSGETLLRLDRPEQNLDRWDPPLHAKLFHATQVNMVATWWLADTLTSELNNLIQAVRNELEGTYRFAEGVLLAPVGDGIIYPVRHTRMEYPHDRALPTQPRSLGALRLAIEMTASEKGVEPQEVHTSALSFS